MVIWNKGDNSKRYSSNLIKCLNQTIPTKHLWTLVPAPFWYLICINFCSGADYALVWCYLRLICIKYGTNLALKL